MSVDLAVRLESCEAVIERGMQTFMEVGKALAEIRDSRLYRTQFETFEDYCRDRWGWTRQYVNGQIRAAETVASLETIVSKDELPVTESQARELSGLDPEQAATVMREVHGQGGKITATAIKVARERIAPKPSTTQLISVSDLAELNAPPDAKPIERAYTPPTPIVDPAPERPSARRGATFEKFVGADPDVQRARFLKQFVDAQGGVLDITRFDPAEVSAVLDADDWDTAERMFGHFQKWWDRLRAQRSSGLKIVGGTDV